MLVVAACVKVPGAEGLPRGRGADPGRRMQGRGKGGGRLCVEGSALACLPLMATEMAFMALIYRALLGVESG